MERDAASLLSTFPNAIASGAKPDPSWYQAVQQLLAAEASRRRLPAVSTSTFDVQHQHLVPDDSSSLPHTYFHQAKKGVPSGSGRRIRAMGGAYAFPLPDTNLQQGTEVLIVNSMTGENLRRLLAAEGVTLMDMKLPRQFS